MYTKNQQRNGSYFHNGHGEFGSMLGNVGQCPSSRFLNCWIEFFKANDQGFESAGVDDCFGELGGVLGDCSENIGCGFFVEAL